MLDSLLLLLPTPRTGGVGVAVAGAAAGAAAAVTAASAGATGAVLPLLPSVGLCIRARNNCCCTATPHFECFCNSSGDQGKTNTKTKPSPSVAKETTATRQLQSICYSQRGSAFSAAQNITELLATAGAEAKCLHSLQLLNPWAKPMQQQQ